MSYFIHHEHVEDFSPEENQAYSDVVCNGLNRMDIELLEFMAENLMVDGDEDA